MSVTAEQIEQLNLLNRSCFYREKSLFVKVKVENIELTDNQCQITISYLSPQSGKARSLNVGGNLEFFSLSSHALCLGGYIAFFLIFDEDLVQKLTVMLTDYPHLDLEQRFEIGYDASLNKLKTIEYYLQYQYSSDELED
ncbi:MAG TPA: hypothetical protein PKL69_04825 [Agitococcus sp.]|uniref:hypothetical protein n=1 Tax=uncultured Agitococcus sp. TaxID=1506599 RepID=UPI002630EB14|nr:hypothetical protein [uncultured Agitococcus sp.]HNB20444.1 hypothetical protein [Agitococcus sp.]HNC86802.1 hypothetical protein [Agitococcus sp.]HNG11167.1 hypothetical protein [Agitococcus sp.]HNG47433.1 hypothetical protein [Agitococcus sp.]HNH44504.1 hypothetical protein [Agitococcus sp.]